MDRTRRRITTLMAIGIFGASLAAQAQGPPPAPAKYTKGDSNVLVLYLRPDGKATFFQQVNGPYPAAMSGFAMNMIESMAKAQAGNDKPDLLFLADASRSAADINRAIAAAKAAGFTVYQAPLVTVQKVKEKK
jgi:hypothetical protein